MLFWMKHRAGCHHAMHARHGDDFEGFGGMGGFGGRGGFGGHGGFGDRGGRGGRGRERMFEQGDVKLLILSLIEEQPKHGYEVIKAIEEMAGGEYSPSPGVIYPTLTMLEELGHASVTNDSGDKKQFSITEEGKAFVDANRETLERIRSRLSAADKGAEARRAPELQRAIQNFRMALHLRLGRGEMSPETLRKIADVIDRAAVEIERL